MTGPRAIVSLAPAVHDRSLGRCEAVWHPGYRCPNRADEIHHRIPRARARWRDEHLLDLWALLGYGDVDHLADLCGPCHRACHRNPARAAGAGATGPFGTTRFLHVRIGLVVPGEIRRVDSLDGPGWRPVYVGDHPQLTQSYPPPKESDR